MFHWRRQLKDEEQNKKPREDEADESLHKKKKHSGEG